VGRERGKKLEKQRKKLKFNFSRFSFWPGQTILSVMETF